MFRYLFGWLRDLCVVFIPALLVVGLVSCADKKTEDKSQIKFGGDLSRPYETIADVVPVDVMNPKLERSIEELRAESLQSNNVVKNDIQGIGVQVAKVADKVQGFGGDLLRLQTHVETSVNLNNEMRAEFKQEFGQIQTELAFNVDNTASLRATLTSQISAIGKLEAQVGELRAQMAASAAAQVGLTNTVKTLSAGRDNNDFDLSKNWKDLLIYSVGAFLGIFGLVMRLDAKRDREILTQAFGVIKQLAGPKAGESVKGEVHEKK